MIDHVTIRVSDLGASRRFYGLALGGLGIPVEVYDDEAFVEWSDFSIAATTPERPVTRGLHVAFQASSRDQVNAWWHAMTEAGHPDDGMPGPRPLYGPEYYGAFVLDPDGRSVEAVHHRPPRADSTVLDHLWLRVRELERSTRFYEAVAPIVGYGVTRHTDRSRIHGHGASFSVVAGGTPTENVHLAFSAEDAATVTAFHAAGVAAGFASLGAPRERPEYHAGYFGAYLADPDGHNVDAVFHDRLSGR